MVARGRVLVVGSPALAIPFEERVDVPAAESVAALRGALAASPGPTDAALICQWGRGAPLTALVDEVRRVVRPGGRVSFIAPVALAGWRGARVALIGALKRRPPVALEELCGALLLGGLRDVRVRPLGRPGGTAVVWARVPERRADDPASSTIRRAQ